MNLCACGCGQKCSRMYVKGHNRKGVKLTEEHRQKLSDNHADVSGEKNPFYGKKHTEKTKTKISDKCSGKIISNEHKQKLSNCFSGEKNPFYGKKHTKKTKRKMKKAKENISEETIDKMSIAKLEANACVNKRYCDEFYDKEYKADCRKARCEHCGLSEEESIELWEQVLIVHHNNGDKNCSQKDLITLCRRCHARLHSYETRFWEHRENLKRKNFSQLRAHSA